MRRVLGILIFSLPATIHPILCSLSSHLDLVQKVHLQLQFQGTQSHPTPRTKEMIDLVGVGETESTDILGTQMELLYQPLMLDECGTLLE
jgi:hypothetical protein